MRSTSDRLRDLGSCRPPSFRLALATMALCVGVALAPMRADAADGPGGRHAIGTNLGPNAVDLSAVPQMSDADIAAMRPSPHPRGGGSDSDYAARKAAASRLAARATGNSGPAPSDPRGRQTPGITFGFTAQSEKAGVTPSDMALAVNKSFVVQVINSSVAVYDRSGVLQTGFPKALKAFFRGTSGDLGDPRAFFDSTAGRFVIEADDFTRGIVHISASQSSDPTQGWWVYTFAPWGAADCRTGGTVCPDFPQLGFDDTTLYLGINLFTATGAISDWMLLLPKAALYSGAGFSYNYWNNLSWGGVNVDTVQPVTYYNAREHARAGFGINSFNINFGGTQCSSGCNGLVVWGFSNNLVATGSPGPELSAVEVPTANTYQFPASASEPGCAFCIDTGDVRISGTPTYHAGVITASLNTNGSDGRSHALWFQVRPSLNDSDARCTGAFANTCPQVSGASIVNEDCFLCGGEGTGGSSYYGALAPDDAGDLTMVYAFSDNNTFPESAYASRRVTQSPNKLHDSGTVLCGGAGEYTQGRWGDYTATAVDGSVPGQDFMWFAAQNSLRNGNWGTCIGGNGYTAESQP